MGRLAWVSAVAAVMLAAVLLSGTPRASTLGASGYPQYSFASAIKENGLVVGSSDTPTGDSHALLWQDGVMTDLGTLGGKTSDVRTVNERGQIVGTSQRGVTSSSWQAG